MKVATILIFGALLAMVCIDTFSLTTSESVKTIALMSNK